MKPNNGADRELKEETTPHSGVLRDALIHSAPVVLGGRRTLRNAAEPARQPMAETSAIGPEIIKKLADAELAGFARGLREGRAQGMQEAVASAQEEGHRKGYAQGWQQGVTEGHLKGEAEVAHKGQQSQVETVQKAERLDQLFDEALIKFRAHLQDRLDAAHDDMVDLCCSAVRQILGDEFTDRRQAVGAVRQAVKRWVATGRHGMSLGTVSVLVHPSDLDLLATDESLAEWLLQRGMQDVKWEADQQVRMGGCIVRSASGDLDARFETQFASLHEVVLGARRHDLGRGVPGQDAAKAVAN